MERRLVSSEAVWEPVVGYSRAVRVGPWIAVAGTTAAAVGGGAVGGDDIGEQTARRCVASPLRWRNWTQGWSMSCALAST